MNLKRYYTTIFALAAMIWLPFAALAQVALIGSDHEVVEVTPAKSTGLAAVYVVYNTQGVSMTYTASSDATVTWMSYDTHGGYAEPVAGVTTSGRVTTLAQVVPNKGYIINEGEGSAPLCVWVVNYADHRLQLNGLSVADSDCGSVTLHMDGKGEAIAYFGVNGVRHTLSREMELSYMNLVWSDDETRWMQVDTTETLDYVKETLAMPSPLCNTSFRLSGDRFLAAWGEGAEASSATFETKAVDARSFAIQEKRENDNEKGNKDEMLGGSAPAIITFKGYPTDAVAHHEWQMSMNADFNDILLRFDQDEVERTFEEAGTTYWRYVVAGNDASCETIGETFTVNIGESELVCPNIFSPGSTEGVNDVWKVSYKSIVEFQCTIFNVWGNEMIRLNDPSEGWDGKYKGKLVSPGVYYYVIQARGSDGKTYKLSGDINIVRYQRNSNSSTSITE